MERRRQRLQLQVGPAGAARERVDPLGARRAPPARARARAGRRSGAPSTPTISRANSPVRPVTHGDERRSGLASRSSSRARLVGDARVLGPLDDRREHAVDVEEERRPRGLGGERGERVHARGSSLADSAEIGNTSGSMADEERLDPARRRADRLDRRAAAARRTPRSTRSSRARSRILAFRTFAYIRVGVLLGQLLVDNDVPDVRRHRDVDRGAAPRGTAPAAVVARAARASPRRSRPIRATPTRSRSARTTTRAPGSARSPANSSAEAPPDPSWQNQGRCAAASPCCSCSRCSPSARRAPVSGARSPGATASAYAIRIAIPEASR